VTAAGLYLDNLVPSLAVAALCCGSCITYIQAAIILLQSENETMLERALRGRMPLVAAAKQVKQVANLVTAYRTASATDRVAFAKTVGPTALFDSTLAPAI
jgi:iron only hydrogenase large subunit-like protein